MIRLYTKSAQGPVEFPAGESFTYAKDQLVIYDKHGAALAPVPLKEVLTATHVKSGRIGLHVEFGGNRPIVVPEERMPLQTDVMATVENRPGSTLGKLMAKAMTNTNKTKMPQDPCKHGMDKRYCAYCVTKTEAPASFRTLDVPGPGEVMGSAG